MKSLLKRNVYNRHFVFVYIADIPNMSCEVKNENCPFEIACLFPTVAQDKGSFSLYFYPSEGSPGKSVCPTDQLPDVYPCILNEKTNQFVIISSSIFVSHCKQFIHNKIIRQSKDPTEW